MLDIMKYLIISYVTFIVVKCHIPNLSVHKVDRQLVARKRQDTLDMCRIFNDETNKLQQYQMNEAKLHTMPYHRSRRSKRDVEEMKIGYAAVSEESAKRIESIVDKLYEDLEENGVKVTYRQRNFDTTTHATPQKEINKTMRRFNFAPAELLYLPTANPVPLALKDFKSPGVPWHKKWKHAIVPYFIDSKTYARDKIASASVVEDPGKVRFHLRPYHHLTSDEMKAKCLPPQKTATLIFRGARDVFSDSHLAEIIMKAFDYFERATCIRLQKLRDRPTDEESLKNVEWLYITNPSGIRQCVHSNERKENIGVQMVVFGYDCLSLGEIVHEVMHILGFSHEHTRPDRDSHISIFWNNIKPGYKRYFEIRPQDQLLNLPYDYASVLHYPPRAFSKNGQITIMGQTGTKLGQREGLSETDVEKVAYIFGHECVERNKHYLLKTCPSVVKSHVPSKNASRKDITDYFKDRLWSYALVNYKIKDKMEFSTEERENIKTVISHIEKETCIRFKDLTTDDDKDDDDSDDVKDEGEKERDKLKTNGTLQYAAGFNESAISDNEIGTSDDNAESMPQHDANETEALRKGSIKAQNAAKIIKTNKRTKSERPANAHPSRRHAANTLVLVRSAEPGCACPRPGKPSGDGILKINADCFNSVNDLLHLFVHVLGLDHQHNMHDRDSYLHILWENLTPEVKNEMKNKLPPAASAGFSYDYQSVMHYPWLQIKNGVTNTMYPIWNDGWAMGHWQGLSSTDVQKLNVLYFEQCIERQKQTGDSKK